jgi:hypothetical protein|nr:hypothetical protein [Candidatus Krumholzibacteria bacterium]
MKKLLILILTLSLAAGSAQAAELGARAGLTSGPDQFHIGAHADLGGITPSLRLVPNVEIGFGDDLTFISFNGDVIHDFPGTGFGVGGELAMQFYDYDQIGSDTELGLSVLGNLRLNLVNGKTVLLEAKLGILDAPDFKFTVGYSLF